MDTKLRQRLGAIYQEKSDKLLAKYDDHDLAKLAKVVGEDKLDAILATKDPGVSFTVADLVKELQIDPTDIKLNLQSILKKS